MPDVVIEDRVSYRLLDAGSSCKIGDVRAVSITYCPAYTFGCLCSHTLSGSKELAGWTGLNQSPYWHGSSILRSPTAGVAGSIDEYRINNT